MSCLGGKKGKNMRGKQWDFSFESSCVLHLKTSRNFSKDFVVIYCIFYRKQSIPLVQILFFF